MNRLFYEPVFGSGREEDELSMGAWYPAVDMFDNDDKIVIKAELPGMKKGDFSVDVKDRVLTLSGERNYENEVKEENYYRRERTCGKFKRAFHLPADVDADNIKAEFKDGVLKVEIPKPEEQKPKQITVH
ncbi:MAG: Hsp20/alpha crystallin family protein [Desulfobacterales bacterium]